MSSVLVVVDNHLVQTPDGKVWSKGIYDYTFFARYLSAFDEVYITIRMEKVNEAPAEFTNLCSGSNVHFLPLPEFRGVNGYLKNFWRVNQLISSYSKKCDCAIIRLPSAIGYQFVRRIDGKKPYALEVVIDPWDFAAPGMLKMKFRSLVRLSWTYGLKKYCLRANGVSYVTQFALQRRYPSGALSNKKDKKYFDSYYSSANIPSTFFMTPKEYKSNQKSFTLIHVANAINSYVKGHKEAIDVVKQLNDKGLNVSIIFVGDGEYVELFQDYAKQQGVINKVNFIGRVSDKNLMKKMMREADLFILPTHGEGLPRVLIESMAVGTPCISTNINGIPELLDENQMAPVGDVAELTRITEKYLHSADLLTQASAKAVEKAKEYSEEVLQIRRTEFYKKLQNAVN